MLNRIVHFSLRFRGVVVALACLLVAYGIHVSYHAKLDVFPNFVPPQVAVQTEAPGLSPEQVEVLVTRPIENSINGLGNMASLRSESISGLSVVTAVFKSGTDIFIARQTLAEKLAGIARELPAGVKAPTMTPLMSATMDLLKVGLVSEHLSPMELRTFADWTVKPRLLSVPGVAHCIVFGGEIRQLQIQLRPDRLIAFGLGVGDVVAAARASTGILGAGLIEDANQRIFIQTEGQSVTPEILGETVLLQRDGQSVRLRDVARIQEGAETKFGDALIMEKPGVLLATASQYGANTMEVTLAVEKALTEMKPLFEKAGVTVYPRMHRPATFIEASLKNIQHSLFLGGVLVAVVLFLFLGHFRTAFISVTAIPVSLLTAVILLDKFGVTLNTITLGGLAIAIGEVVDDAIIDVENIFRRLRENQTQSVPRSVFRVVLEASIEVRSAVVYATFIVALIFLPVLTLTGLQGSFFAPLALSYILAILASLVVALTLTPALSLLFFARGVHQSAEPRLQTWLKSGYISLLNFFARAGGVMILAVVVLCLTAVGMLPQFGTGFLPEFREGHFVLQVQSVPGTSLPSMMQMGREISHELLKNKLLATVEQQIGRAEQGEDTWGSHRCEFHLELVEGVSGRDQEKIMSEIRDLLEEFPGIQGQVLTFLGDRISETITGETAPVVINIFGEDLNVIDEKAREIEKLLIKIPGAKDVQLKSPPGGPRLSVRLRLDRLAQFGYRPVEVLEAVQIAYEGMVVAQIHQGNRVADVKVILQDSSRRDVEGVGDLRIKNAQGLLLPLKQLADIELTSGRYSIMHEGALRRQVVTCQVQGRDVSSLVAQAKKEMNDQVKFNSGVYAVFSGTAEATEAARRELMTNSAIAAAGILLLLVVVTGNWRNLLLILANVPFALVGGVLAVFLSVRGGGEAGEGGVTIGSLVGFVTLFGITTRNSIMLISHYEHLVQQEGLTWGLETAIRGASERLIPILMTATVTALGLLPLALGSGEVGREIEGPMALVILGGLLTSTVLNLIVLPTLSLHFGRFEKPTLVEE